MHEPRENSILNIRVHLHCADFASGGTYALKFAHFYQPHPTRKIILKEAVIQTRMKDFFRSEKEFKFCIKGNSSTGKRGKENEKKRINIIGYYSSAFRIYI